MKSKPQFTSLTQISETQARAEAMYVVMKLMIASMPTRARNRLSALALLACDKIGSPEIMEEMEGLFDHPAEPQTV